MTDAGRWSRLVRRVRSRPRRLIAAGTALVIAIPVTFAVLHEGFPLTTADFDARTVWVSNGDRALAGRVNRQIDQLTGSVVAAQLIDIAQDGDDVFTLSGDGIAKVDPAFVQFQGLTEIPPGSDIGLGGDRLLIANPGSGDAWVVPATLPLVIDLNAPTLELGSGGVAAISRDGLVMGYAPASGELSVLRPGAGAPEVRDIGEIDGDATITMVGDRGVILDAESRSLLLDDGTTRFLDVEDGPLRLQQAGPEASTVLVATADALLSVGLASDEQTAIDVRASTATEASQLAAPVRVADCSYGAWTTTGVVVWQCGDAEPVENTLAEQPGDLRFRVNRDEVVLNDIALGRVYVLDDDLTQIADWDLVPQTLPEENDDGTEENDDQAIEQEPPPRSPENSPPVAVDDRFGARPGQTTVLPVLDNDLDPDGDLLVVSSVDQPPASSGTLELIDGGRALQFSAAATATGAVTVRYSVSDGRPGGASSANLTIVVGSGVSSPVQVRETVVRLEQGQTLSHNVLADWTDPDGDEIYLRSATGTSGDVVRFTPDGLVNFGAITSELGAKTVEIVVSDGTEAPPTTGTFTVRVESPGTLSPSALPDHVTMVAGRTATVVPLANDRNPTGSSLLLTSVTALDESVGVSIRPDNGEVALTAAEPGSYYLEYVVAAGPKNATGVIRLDVLEATDDPAPPIAVRDVAYLRPGQSVDLAVLANDVSPDGLVLGVQSVQVDAADTAVTVEILKNTLLRVSSSSALDGTPVRFSYTVSDGGPTPATASVVVIPVPALLSHQPPIANDDAAVVRVGDYVSVSVLDNDLHPDGSRMELASVTDDLPAASGFAFVSGSEVRYQAPDEAGSYAVGYQVVDEFGQFAAATVTFTVTELDEEANRPPAPPTLTARVFEGSDVLIELPSTGLDPDGDSASFIGSTSAPVLGVIEQSGATSFRYRAAPGATGTDEFEIALVDAFGATGLGVVRIGVLPRPASTLPPSAVEDLIAVRPGRQATVAVLANDSDPSGMRLSLVRDSLVPDPGGVTAAIDEIDPTQVVVTVPDELDSGSYYVAYAIANEDGVEDTGNIVVQVDPDAPLLPPVAFDHVITTDEASDGDRVEVEVLSDARNPGGTLEELEVTLTGPGAGFADVAADGTVTVELGDRRRVIAFTLTNADDLSATAFIVAPDREAALRPQLRPEVGTLRVPSGELIERTVGDLVFAPTGGDLRVTDGGSATHAAPGHVVSVDGETVSYQSAPGYSGPASMTFAVADGDPDDEDTRTAFITVPIIVEAPEAAAEVPTFAGGIEQVVVLESSAVDLRARTVHPDRDELDYGDVTGQTDDIEVSEQGDRLVLTAAPGSTGEKTTVSFTISGAGIDPVRASFDVIVVASNRPFASAVEDVLYTRRPDPSNVNVLRNDVNPYSGDQPLKVVDLEPEENGAQIQGQPSFTTDGDVTVRPVPGFVGTISLLYTVEDASLDESRQVTGRLRLIYRDVPDNDAVNTSGIGTQSEQLTVTINDAPTDNGATIDRYQVSISPAVAPSPRACTFGQPCVFGGLTNGQRYCFDAQAHNELGWSATWSLGCKTPYGTPPTPTGLSLSGDYDGITLTSYSATVGSSGGIATINWRVDQTGETGSVPYGTPTIRRSVGSSSVVTGGTYTMSVQSCTPADPPDPPVCSVWSAPSNAVTIPYRPTLTAGRLGGAGGEAVFPPGDDPYSQPTGADHIVVNFTNLPGGRYQFCAETTAGDAAIHWYHWTSSGQANEVRGGPEKHCGVANIAANGSVEPFGMVLGHSYGVSVGFWICAENAPAGSCLNRSAAINTNPGAFIYINPGNP